MIREIDGDRGGGVHGEDMEEGGAQRWPRAGGVLGSRAGRRGPRRPRRRLLGVTSCGERSQPSDGAEAFRTQDVLCRPTGGARAKAAWRVRD